MDNQKFNLFFGCFNCPFLHHFCKIVYSGSDIPGANGKLIVADINLSTANPLTYRIFAVNKDNGDIEKLDVRNVPTGYAAQGVFGGNDGEVYVMGQDSLRNGVIYKLVPFIE
jgi:hypothetical protein